MAQPIDFSNFSPEILRSIEETAKFSRQLGRHVIDAACMVAGFCRVDPPAVRRFFTEAGYDMDRSMERLAQTFVKERVCPDGGGILFSQEVTDSFEYCTSHYRSVGLPQLLDALLRLAPGELTANLVGGAGGGEPRRQPEPAPEPAPEPRQPRRNLSADDSSTGGTVKQYCANMLRMAADGKIHHAIGRDEEVDRVLLILARSTKNNPVLVGEAGTGKTAIAEELALRLLYGDVPADLARLKLYSLDFAAVKSSQDRVGTMRKILEEASADPDLVIFIDEIHMIISNCSCSDNDIANLMKPAMARGEIKLLGATTLDEYRRIESDPAFERRFQKVIVEEPKIDSAIEILKGAKGKFETYHSVTIPDEVCKTAVTLSARYITNRRLPDKAFDLIDEAAANLRTSGDGRRTMTANDVMKVITAWTGIPVDDLDTDENARLQNIEEELHRSVIGQDKAVKAVADAIKRSRLGFSDPNRPIGSFLFLGTTGTGKTELCKAIAKFLFNDPNAMVRLDMSEYQQEFSAHRMFGAPPGYVGYEAGGQLTEAIYRKPFNVVLFDEIEKAHPKIFETLFQVLDEGRMTDGKGKVVNFKNTLIVMTSNMGQDEILSALVGRDATDQQVAACTENVMRQLHVRVDNPAFLNRIDNIVMFMPLSRTDVADIAKINLDREIRKLADMEIRASYDSGVIEFIVEHGYQPEFGGRPVKRAITEHIINPLTSAMVDGTVRRQSPIRISVEGNKIAFRNGTPTRI
ncbi:MAG: ATP-dependent Clp protease ATP-binding subunit [Clostridium sp.]|nr:ATP-dependent Clp protease ATP-binding subunit [Clostridium sp.]